VQCRRHDCQTLLSRGELLYPNEWEQRRRHPRRDNITGERLPEPPKSTDCSDVQRQVVASNDTVAWKTVERSFRRQRARLHVTTSGGHPMTYQCGHARFGITRKCIGSRRRDLV